MGHSEGQKLRKRWVRLSVVQRERERQREMILIKLYCKHKNKIQNLYCL